MPGYLKPYKSYVFKDKDPIIDIVRTVVEDSGMKYKTVHEDSGVSTACMYNWFHGDTKRPQYATVMAVLMACGKKLVVVNEDEEAKKPRRAPHLKLLKRA